MNMMIITPDSEYTTQSIVLNLTIKEKTKRCVMTLQYMDRTDKWYCTLSNLQTGEIYFTNVPILTTAFGLGNDLWAPFFYKEVGMLFCFPKAEPSTPDPSMHNFDEFILVWSDGVE